MGGLARSLLSHPALPLEAAPSRSTLVPLRPPPSPLLRRRLLGPPTKSALSPPRAYVEASQITALMKTLPMELTPT